MALEKDGQTPTVRRARRTRALAIAERVAKDTVRLRDRQCRFPLCGCRRQRMGVRGGGKTLALLAKTNLTVSHDVHKGMGGDPSGAVSIAPLMILLCQWRHQHAPVSRHAGTLRTVYLTPNQNDGPVAFEIDLRALRPGLHEAPLWVEVGRETYDAAGHVALRLDELTDLQRELLDELAEMQR